MPVDFSKPVEVKCEGESNSGYRPARVLGAVNYRNNTSTHAVVVTKSDGSETVHAAGADGHVEYGYIIRNTPPKVVEEFWVNLYSDGCTGCMHYTKEIADEHETSSNRFGYYVTKTYDDGSVTNEVIKIEE